MLKSSFSIYRVFSIMTVEKGQKQIINVLLQALEEPRLKNGFKTNIFKWIMHNVGWGCAEILPNIGYLGSACMPGKVTLIF